jgi:carboxyl-terminal processing protease
LDVPLGTRRRHESAGQPQDRIEKLEGGITREENLKGALDKNVTSKKSNSKNAAASSKEDDQSKVDYQLARALDLIQGVSIFTEDKLK